MKYEIGSTLEMRAANGHLYIYIVRKPGPDGYVRVWQHNARHSDNCDCSKWEGEDQSVPDW